MNNEEKKKKKKSLIDQIEAHADVKKHLQEGTEICIERIFAMGIYEMDELRQLIAENKLVDALKEAEETNPYQPSKAKQKSKGK